MRYRCTFVYTALPTMLFLLITTSAFAQTPLKLTITKPFTPVTEILASLAKQSGTPIVADDTVVDTLGAGTVAAPTVPEMLDAIKELLPDLTWERVEIPKDAPVPNADNLSAEMRELQALNEGPITITDPVKRLTTRYSLTESHRFIIIIPSGKEVRDLPAIADPSDKIVYLVTDEVVRNVRDYHKQLAADKQRGIDATNREQALRPTPQAGLLRVFGLYKQLTPEEQHDNLESMVFKWREIIRATDPAVLLEVEQQYPGLVGDPPTTPVSPPTAPGR
jgi:hypothetical protein